MSCGFCGEALSGLTSGLVALVSFIIISISQIVFASLKLIADKIRFLKK